MGKTCWEKRGGKNVMGFVYKMGSFKQWFQTIFKPVIQTSMFSISIFISFHLYV